MTIEWPGFTRRTFWPPGCGRFQRRDTPLALWNESGGAILPTQTSKITRQGAAAGERLAWQLAVTQDMRIDVPAEIFGVQQWTCTTRSNENVSAFIKERVLALPEGEEIEFRLTISAEGKAVAGMQGRRLSQSGDQTSGWALAAWSPGGVETTDSG